MRLKKKLIMMMVVAVAVLLVMLPTSGVYAADQFEVTGGTLTITGHSDGFTTANDTWVISAVDAQFIQSEPSLVASDLTGSNEGWIYTTTFTDFTATGIADPSVAAATLSLNADVEDWLSVVLEDSLSAEIIAQAITPTDGTAIIAANYTANDTIVGSGNLAILEVEPGYGAGTFGLELVYTIDFSRWLPDGTTITSSAVTGEFASGTPVTVNNATQKYQIFPGTYETTVTFSIAGNPAV